MTKRFSKLKKQIDSFFVPELKMEFCCYAYRVRADRDKSLIPRYCVKMNGEIIWDFPKDFEVKNMNYAHWAENNGIIDLVREYMDAPLDGLLERKFNGEMKVYHTNGHCDCPPTTVNHHLTDLFKAADRRLGKENLMELALRLKNPAVLRIIIERYKLREILPTYKLSFGERAIIGMDMIARQEPVTLEQARAQAQRLKKYVPQKQKGFNYTSNTLELLERLKEAGGERHEIIGSKLKEIYEAKLKAVEEKRQEDVVKYTEEEVRFANRVIRMLE